MVGRKRVPRAHPLCGWFVVIHQLSLRALWLFGVSSSSWIFELLMTPVSAIPSLPLLFLSHKVLFHRLSPHLSHSLVASSTAKVKAVLWGDVRPVPGILRAGEGYRECYTTWPEGHLFSGWLNQCFLANEAHNRKCFSRCVHMHMYEAE